MKRSRLRRRKCQPVLSPAEKTARLAWRRAVCRYGCHMCHAFPVDDYTRLTSGPDLATIDPHHVLSQRFLKDRGLEDELWNPANGIGLCRYHHFRHEHYVQRVPHALLPDAAVSFASEHALAWRLTHDYK